MTKLAEKLGVLWMVEGFFIFLTPFPLSINLKATKQMFIHWHKSLQGIILDDL